jgi:release factor glutamine methyltransferase
MSASANSKAPEPAAALPTGAPVSDRQARRALVAELEAAVGSEREARWILEETLCEPERARRLAKRRADGEPLQHVLGHWGFRRLDVLTDRRALVPRPETEVVVEAALGELDRLDAEQGAPPAVRTAVDLGTGSGIIACSLVAEASVPLVVYATDASTAALALARDNAERALGPDALGGEGSARRLVLRPGSWFEALPASLRGRIDLVVSNPPYLAEEEWPELDPVVRDYDPYGALVSGPTGLEAISHLIEGALAWLATPGSLVLEIAPHQSDRAISVATQAGYRTAEVRPDLAGRQRVLVARR